IANGAVQAAPAAPAGIIVGSTDGSVLTTRDDMLVHLHQAFARETLTLTLEGSVEPVIQIDHRSEGAAAHVNDSIKIFAADDSSAVILETFSGSDAAHVGNH